MLIIISVLPSTTVPTYFILPDLSAIPNKMKDKAKQSSLRMFLYVLIVLSVLHQPSSVFSRTESKLFHGVMNDGTMKAER